MPFEMLMEEAVSPYVLISQKLIEPRAAKTSGQDMVRKLQSFSVGESDLRSYARAMFSWSALRPCRMLLPRLMPIIFDRNPSFGGCSLVRPYESDPKTIILGPHCQCALRAQHLRGRGQEAVRSNRMSWTLNLPASLGGRRRRTQSVTLVCLCCIVIADIAFEGKNF